MLILGINTVADACEAALVRDGAVIAERAEPMNQGHDARLAPVVEQLMRDAGIPFGDLHRVAVVVGPGSFTGVRVGVAFAALAREAGLSPAQLALLWVKDQPGVTAPIFGARTVAQLDEAIPVMELQLSDALRAACDALVPPGSAVVNFHNSAAWMRMQLNP